MDNYAIRFTAKAKKDLDGVYRYIAEFLQESGTAEKMLDTLESEICSLKNLSNRCPERHRGIYADKGYRQLQVKNYTVIYRVDADKKQVVIVAVRYSRSQF